MGFEIPMITSWAVVKDVSGSNGPRSVVSGLNYIQRTSGKCVETSAGYRHGRRTGTRDGRAWGPSINYVTPKRGRGGPVKHYHSVGLLLKLIKILTESVT